MNENLLTIEKRSSINRTFWKKRFTDNNINTNKNSVSKLNNILETILFGRNIKMGSNKKKKLMNKCAKIKLI